MITQAPDRSLDFSKLEQSLIAVHSRLNDNETYQCRETYVDRGRNVLPHFLIRFSPKVNFRGDDLYHEPLFCSRNPAIYYKHLTRSDEFNQPEYWKALSGKVISKRLDRFMDMCKHNYLQPPGERQPAFGEKVAHEKFEAKPFQFEVSSPWSSIIGLCPLNETAVADFGAIEGMLKDVALGELEQLALIVKNEKGDILKRSFSTEGQFWFAKLPPGNYNLEIQGYNVNASKSTKPFGWVKGKSINDLGEHPTVQLEAPDKTVFNIKTGSGGSFNAHVPPFPYQVTIPGHWFKSKVWVKGNTIIAGILKNGAMEGMTGKTVTLRQSNAVMATATTEKDGAFRFELSTSGKFSLEVEGFGLYAKKVAPASIKGRLEGGATTVIELIARERVVSTTTSNPSGGFAFNGLTAGSYTLRMNRPFVVEKQYAMSERVAGVLRSSDRMPLSDQTVRLLRLPDRTLTGATTTDGNGHFQFDQVPTGRYLLSAIDVAFKEQVSYVLQGNITGTLKDDAGNVLSQSRISLYKQGAESPIKSILTNHEGTFLFDDLPPGTYFLKYGNRTIKPEHHA